MIEILQSELRDVDEIDKEKFTIYILNIALEGRDAYVISRRYSQFHELMTEMCKANAKAKEVPFPPKVLMGKLAPRVIARRTAELQEWTNAMLSHTDDEISKSDKLLAFLEAKDGMVTVGAEAPTGKIVDIHGRNFDPSKYGSDWLIIYTAASRYNFQALTKFIKAADPAIKEKYPTLKCVFMNVADLRVVPENMQGQVLPIIKSMDSKNVSQSLNAFSLENPGTYNGQDMFFKADWSGETIGALGCDDANWTYRLFVVGGGRILSSLQSSTPGIVNEYMQAMDSAIESFPKAAVAWPTGYPNHSIVKKDEIKVKAGQVHTVDIEVTEAGLLGWQVQVTNANTVEVSMVRAGDEEVVVVPKRKLECKVSPCCQVCHVDPGTYRINLDNTSSTLKTKEVKFQASTSGFLGE